MRRRDFIAGLGAVAAWPLASAAQAPMRRIGVLMNGTAVEATYQAELAAFVQGLRQFGLDRRAKIFALRCARAAPIPRSDGGAGHVLADQLELVVRLIMQSVPPIQARNV